MGMKEWALQGVTHYTHWFQPLTGTTAENTMLLKHLMTAVIQ
jgi:glutamine synthetase type III